MLWTLNINYSEGDYVNILKVEKLKVRFNTLFGVAKAVNNLSFEVEEGEILGIVGESGSGKSVTALSIMNLIDKNKADITGKIVFDKKNLLQLDESEYRNTYGKDISMIFQEPMTSLNPLKTIYNQINEVFRIHGFKNNNRNEIVDLITKLNISNPDELLKKYPFELSGGLRQRVMIAIAIALKPRLIIADEPTTALDVTTQSEILFLLKKMVKEMGSSLIIVTHDLGVIAELADKVLVMYGGEGLEYVDALTFFDNPIHPYSKDLLNSLPNRFNNSFNTINGAIPSVYEDIVGCVYADRCKYSNERCFLEKPKLIDLNSHKVACWKET